MAGKKQHYIPRSLLRGFCRSENDKQEQAFVFKPGRLPYLASISDIAAERFFYSDLDEKGLKTTDDRITGYENHFAPLLRNLRQVGVGQIADPLVSAEVVVHLSVRGAYLREFFSTGVRQLIQAAEVSWRTPDAARLMLSIDESESTTIFTQTIDNEIEKYRANFPQHIPTQFLRRLILHSAREDFDDLFNHIQPVIGDALRQIMPQVPGAMRDGHAKLLETTMAPDSRVSDLAALEWTILRII